jgi:hypothetical protein
MIGENTMRTTHTAMNVCRTAALALMLAVTPALAQSSAAPEGIKVHGDWTLVIRNPDGTVAAVHEFKNALSTATGADQRLASLLGGAAVPGQWTIGLSGFPNDNLCGMGFGCYISEVPLSYSHATNLTKTLPTEGPDIGKLVLRGSVRMLKPSNLAIVTTALTTCPAASPAPCVSLSYPEFTRKLLDIGVPVTADQLVEVKVVISFS